MGVRKYEEIEGFKVCRCCKQQKPYSEFYRWKNSSDGYHFYCKECKRQMNEKRYSENKDVLSKRVSISRAIRRQLDPEYDEKIKAYSRKQAKSESYKRANQKYRKVHKDRIAAYESKRVQENIQVRITKRLRTRLHHFVNSVGIYSYHTTELLGCSWEYLRDYLEKQFESGMNWDNYGKNGWVIDHVVPCSYFDMTDDVQVHICFNFRNLQPLWAKDNGSKNDSLPENYQEIINQIKEEIYGK